MRTITRILLYPFKDIIGIGYGTCGCCKFPWNLVDIHDINITSGSGMFATCEDCWRNKSDEEIIAAYNKVYDDWLCGDKYNKPHTPEEIGFSRHKMLVTLYKDLALRSEKKK